MLVLAGPQDFECVAAGNTLLVPSASVEAVCARIAARTARVREHMGPVRIVVHFTRAGVASAQVTRTINGRREELPDISIATSDKAMSLQTVEMLADEIARALAPR